MNLKRTLFLFMVSIALVHVSFLTSMAQAQTNLPGYPDSVAMLLPRADHEILQWKEHDFIAFNPRYKEELGARVARIRTLSAQVIANEIAGQHTWFSHQVLSEIIWLISSTADFTRIDQRLNDLQASIDHPEYNSKADEQDPADGSWGKGYTQWIFKVIASYSHLKNSTYEFHFLDQVNSPEKLTDYLVSLSISDISKTGIDHEREFNEAISNLMRMILRQRPKQYVYDPKLKATIMDLLLHRFRNPATGYWGERYVHDGKVEFVDDLSITFHVISYLDGDVPDMDKVVMTTLAAKNFEFPVGCLYKGQHYDHLNMDVAELFRLGWPHATEEQKKGIRIELHELLHWCLTESLQPDGSFKFWIGDNSKEETTYYGASFLARIGYFDKSRRFWTDEDFPEAEGVRQRIISYIEAHSKSGPTGGDYYESALNELNYKPAR